jgi:DNA polymerase I-like protein with 3'-5' exonuclease and polymerase domains/uracil-DNA glycosylase
VVRVERLQLQGLAGISELVEDWGVALSRRPRIRQIERTVYDAQAAGAQCGVCPLSVSCKPCRPGAARSGGQSDIRNGGILVVVGDNPSRYDDVHGREVPSTPSKFLERSLASAGATEYIKTWATLCRPPEDATNDDINNAIASCAPRLANEMAHYRAQTGIPDDSRLWVLALGEQAFRATTGLHSSSEPWRGSPIKKSQEAGGDVGVIPTFDPGYVLSPKGTRFGRVFQTHVERAVQFSKGQLSDFVWPESLVDDDGRRRERLGAIAELAKAGGEVSVDIETRGLGLDSEISCIGIASDVGSVCVQLPFESADTERLVRDCLRSGVMVGQNISAFDRQVLKRAGYELTSHYEDTLLAASILDPQLPKNLGALVSADFHAEAHKAAFKADKETGVLSGMWDSLDPAVERERRIYCLRDAYTTLLVWQRQKERLADYGQVLYESLKEADKIALHMRDTGIAWDAKAAKELEDKYVAKLKQAEEHLQRGTDSLGWRRPRVNAEGKNITRKKPLNPGSTHQLAELFFQEMKLAPTIWTDKGRPSTNDDALMNIITQADNPTAVAFAKKVTDYRDAEKALGTYIRGMAPGAQMVDSQGKPSIDVDYPIDNRVHGAWRAHTAPTARWSCTVRGFQTLDGEMRRLLTVEEGNVAIEADLPSAEVRTVMLFAGQDDIIDLLNDGGDLYSAAATKMFGKPVSKKENKHLRQLGKLTILASHYGAAGATVFFQIWKDLIDPADPDSKTIIETFPDLNPRKIEAIQNLYFRDTAPKVKLWQHAETKASGERGFYLSPLDGRKVDFYGAADLNFATNFPNQATVAWWMNGALRRIHKQLLPQDKLLTYIHDSLTLETPAKEIDRVRSLLVKEMEGEIHYRGRTVKMAPVEWKVGPNLAAVK